MRDFTRPNQGSAVSDITFIPVSRGLFSYSESQPSWTGHRERLLIVAGVNTMHADFVSMPCKRPYGKYGPPRFNEYGIKERPVQQGAD